MVKKSNKQKLKLNATKLLLLNVLTYTIYGGKKICFDTSTAM